MVRSSSCLAAAATAALLVPRLTDGFAPPAAAAIAVRASSSCCRPGTAREAAAGAGDPASGSIGGEWAGWECRFSQADGQRMTIPEDYVPESLREWDVPVWGFEVLNSEKLEGQYRKRAQVYPETGCALDDLSVEMRIINRALDDPAVHRFHFPGGTAIIEPATFGGTHAVEVVIPTDTSATRRVRVVATVDAAQHVLSRPLVVAKERRYGAFDDGELYNRGLDIRTLTELIDAKCFAEYEEAPAVDPPADGTKVLPLRGGVVVRVGPWELMRKSFAAAHASTSVPKWVLAMEVPTDSGKPVVVAVAFSSDGAAQVLVPAAGAAAPVGMVA